MRRMLMEKLLGWLEVAGLESKWESGLESRQAAGLATQAHWLQQLAQRPDSFWRGSSVGRRRAPQAGTWSRTYGLLRCCCMSFLARRLAW